MTAPLEKIPALIAAELEMIWAAHKAVGLVGFMCAYTNPTQVPFRSKEAGIALWFGPEDTDDIVKQIVQHYNKGILPNSPLLLNPVVHAKKDDGSYEPIGSGIIWSTSLCLGIDLLKPESLERIVEQRLLASPYERGESKSAGLKIIGICDKVQRLTEDGVTVTGCRALYDLADIKSDQYAHAYLLSGLSYLTNNGLFQHPDVGALFPKDALKDGKSTTAIVKSSTISAQKAIDAAYCWNSYERYHSLYKKFGYDPADVETNLKFFSLVARDVKLFDATGPMRKDADETFEFIVPGWIPRGSITLLAATGGTGKSTLAHELCILSAIDYEPGEEPPRWLGQPIAIEKCKGICVYFSGEDGAPIINARARTFDPEGRAKRLMFQRSDFGEGVSFADYITQLEKIPQVPIMVIDPARKFLSGDEDNAGAVSDFFKALEEFAMRKGTAVVVVHHLQKNAKPKAASEVLDMLRGSQVFVDRPRVVIGMYRDGAYTIAGLAKNNIPPNLGMVTEERVFARDPQSLKLVWLPGHEGVRNATLSPEEIAKISEQARKEGR